MSIPTQAVRVAAFAIAGLVAASVAHAAEPGARAPAFALPTAGGQTIALETLRGRVVYVDFWASWCAPCKRSFPFMNALARRYGDDRVTIVAINVDKKRADAQRFLAQTPAEFAVVYDPAGATAAAYDVRAMPSTYLIDRDGNVAWVEQGFREERAAEIEARLRALLP
jgi:thiol-disulfide isomerase/thioredoxin